MDAYVHFLAGWGAGMFGVIIGHPMDTVKTYQQISNEKFTTLKVLKLIMRTNGIKGFYKGMFFPLLSSGALNSIYFGIFNEYLNFAKAKRGYEEIKVTNPNYIEDVFIAGFLGGGTQALITCPSELVKTRMQAGKVIERFRIVNQILKPKASNYLTVMDIFKRSGPTGFYVGFIPTLYRDALGGGIYMSVYQYVRFFGPFGSDTPERSVTFVASGLAGVLSWIPLLPFDTVKSRLQGDVKGKYKGMIHCALDLYAKSGFRGFFKGIFMISVRAVPVNIAILYGYELSLWFFESHEEEIEKIKKKLKKPKEES